MKILEFLFLFFNIIVTVLWKLNNQNPKAKTKTMPIIICLNYNNPNLIT